MSEHTARPVGREYSQRLGVLAPDQFQAALARFELGDFVEAAPVSGGLFDLMEYYFGDGEADMMRLMASYLDWGQHHDMRLAHAFGTAYLESRPARPGFAERYALFMLRDRLITWEYGTRPGHDWFPEGWSFRDYAERYMLSYRYWTAL